MSLIIFVGDVTQEVADAAKAIDPTAYLLDHNNYKDIKRGDHATVYTSLADLAQDHDTIFQLFDLADDLVYWPPKVWSDGKIVNPFDILDSAQGATEYALLPFIKIKQNVSNAGLTKDLFDLITKLEDSRCTEQTQLWVAGCSYTVGVGVDPKQRYGTLLSKQLGLPVSTLARPGKSISWAADQILRSNIKANDIVVWGLTGERRFSYWQENQIHTYTINHRQQPFQHFILSPSQLDKFIADDNMIYQAVTQIRQVVNFCQKTQSKLLILGLLESPEIDMALGNTTEFVKYINLESPSTLVDLGTDNEHPGPQQHQLYADFCHSALQKLNYI